MTAGTDAIAVVRRNTEEVQGAGNFATFDELFASEFVDHTPQPGFGNDREAVRGLYAAIREAFPDFRADIHFQFAEAGGNRVVTYKTYHGTHRGNFMGVKATGRRISFETVDVMEVVKGKITAHWGVGNLFSLAQQLGAIPGSTL